MQDIETVLCDDLVVFAALFEQLVVLAVAQTLGKVGLRTGPPTADVRVVAPLDRVFLHAVQTLGDLLPCIPRAAPLHEGEHHLQFVAEVAGDMVLQFDLGRHRKTCTVNVAEHVAQTFQEQSVVLAARVGGAHHGARVNVVYVVCLHAVAVLVQCRQVAVVGRELRQRELRLVTAHVRPVHPVVVKRIVAPLVHGSAVMRHVQVTPDCRRRQLHRSAVLEELVPVIQFAALFVVDLYRSAHEQPVHVPDFTAERLVRKRVDRAQKTFDAVCHLAFVVVAEAFVYKRQIPLLLVLFVTGTQFCGKNRQRVVPLPAELLIGDRRGDRLPQLLLRRALAHETTGFQFGGDVLLDAVQHRGVRRVLGDSPGIRRKQQVPRRKDDVAVIGVGVWIVMDEIDEFGLDRLLGGITVNQLPGFADRKRKRGVFIKSWSTAGSATESPNLLAVYQ